MKKLLNAFNYPFGKKKEVETTKKWMALFATFSIILLFPSCQKETRNSGAQPNTASVNRSVAANSEAPVKVVFATGLNNPRGLEFGPDGYLYVAEGGAGGTLSTIGQCEQAHGAGPYTGGFTSRISKISPGGVRSTVVGGLPSSQTNPNLGSLVSGVADVAFIDGQLYGLESGAGCSHGLAGTSNTVFRVNKDGTTTTIANLSAFLQANPVANRDEDDFEPDGTWYGMVAVHGGLYLTQPNGQELDRVTLDGHVSRVLDMSTIFLPQEENWQGATGIAYHGNFYITQLGQFPVRPGTQGVYKITPGGQIQKVAGGLTAVLGIAFDKQDRIYVLEMTTAAGNPTPNTGKVVRILPSGQQEEIVTGLFFPTGMTMGPDGKLYISNVGFGPPPIGAGQILQIDIKD